MNLLLTRINKKLVGRAGFSHSGLNNKRENEGGATKIGLLRNSDI